MSFPVPKKPRLRSFFAVFFQSLGIVASILAFIRIERIVPETAQGMVYALFLVLTTLALALYIFIIHVRKLNRYADIPPFIHFVNHTVRDVLTRTRKRIAKKTFSDGDIEEIEQATVSILNAISQCFSILTGSHCGVCIKEILDPEKEGDRPRLTIAYRDSYSQMTRGVDDSLQECHVIDADTPCASVFSGENGCHRGYLCNDVKHEWTRENYVSPSFERYGGPPQFFTIFGLTLVRNWCLHYKSTIVSPIRFRSYPRNGGQLSSSGKKFAPRSDYWGFLCVDAKKRNLFNESRHREVIAAFSDALFLYFNELHDVVDRYSKTEK